MIKREHILIFLLFCSSSVFCQIQFNTDTLYSISVDSDKTFTPVIGQVWFLQNSIMDDTVILTRDKMTRGSDRYNFFENGELEINSCFEECGKYICGFIGSWQENNNSELYICIDDDAYDKQYNLFFFYSYSLDKRKLILRKISKQ